MRNYNDADKREKEVWENLKREIASAIASDVSDLSGDNPALRGFLKSHGAKLALQKDTDLDKVMANIYGAYSLCKADFREKTITDVNKTTSQQLKTVGGIARRTAGAATEVAASTAAGAALGTIGAASILTGNPGFIFLIGTGALKGARRAISSPWEKIAKADNSVKTLTEIRLAINEVQNPTSREEMNEVRKLWGSDNIIKHAEHELPERRVVEGSGVSTPLIADGLFTEEVLKQSCFSHFNDMTDEVSDRLYAAISPDSTLTISAPTTDVALMSTMLQYQMVRHFGKLSDDGKKILCDQDKFTKDNIEAFKADLNKLHKHMEDYTVFHEAINNIKETHGLTPRTQNKMASTIIPALINNPYQCTGLATKLTNKLLEKSGSTGRVYYC